MEIAEKLQKIIGQLKADQPITEIVAALLAPLKSYDSKTGSDLERTLMTFVAQGSLSSTARALFLHRNSVMYRLQRIETLTGILIRKQSVRDQLLIILSLVYSDNLRLKDSEELTKMGNYGSKRAK